MDKQPDKKKNLFESANEGLPTDDTPQSDEQEQRKEWTIEEMEEAQPFTMPEVPDEKEPHQGSSTTEGHE